MVFLTLCVSTALGQERRTFIVGGGISCKAGTGPSISHGQIPLDSDRSIGHELKGVSGFWHGGVPSVVTAALGVRWLEPRVREYERCERARDGIVSSDPAKGRRDQLPLWLGDPRRLADRPRYPVRVAWRC